MCQWNAYHHSKLQPGFLQSYRVTEKEKHVTPIKNNQHLEKIQGQAGSLTILSETIQKERTMFPFSILSSSLNHSQSHLQSHMTQGRMVQPGMECVSCLNTLQILRTVSVVNELSTSMLKESSRQEKADTQAQRKKNNLCSFPERVTCTPMNANIHQWLQKLVSSKPEQNRGGYF